ncbi:MAG: putative two-component system response regulator [Candidatus Pseudothioglobus sp.]|jgi:putative two-component system response regulator
MISMRSAESRPLVAIVDDELGNAQLLSMALAADYETCIANTGKDALCMIKSRTPDLILLDIMIPDIDGYEICIKLKTDKETAKIPIIFITGLEGSENEELGFEVGAADYLYKPINATVMTMRIARILDNAMYIEFLENMATQREHTIETLRKNAQATLKNSKVKAI